jgi:hypothetical protein
MDIDASKERGFSPDRPPYGPAQQFDLRVVRGKEFTAVRRNERTLIRRPSSLRTGIFCRFGLRQDNRPVAVRSGRR